MKRSASQSPPDSDNEKNQTLLNISSTCTSTSTSSSTSTMTPNSNSTIPDENKSTISGTKKSKQKRPRVAMEEASTGTLRRVAHLSDAFISYYRDILHWDHDWDKFVATLQKELPTSFRITSMGALRSLVQLIFEKVFLNDFGLRHVALTSTLAPGIPQKSLVPTSLDIEPPTSVPWYLDGRSAYTYSIARIEDEAGHTSGQELVSMIPGVVLDVHPHHLVLDMCAAPGSKSGQLLERLHYGLPSDTVPAGVVVSNELDVERAYLLTHRIQLFGSPCMLVINYPAQHIPTFQSPDAEPVLFDRVLADVPCSGDGTFRKAPHLAAQWDNRSAMALHKLQLPIAIRGVELLKVGGRMVYSTCSMNPIENEAVVAALLREFNGALELVDPRAMLSSLHCRAGLGSWTVWDHKLGAVGNYEQLDGGMKFLFAPTMFPPESKELPSMHLERCLRIHPHDNDSGGFFVAVLSKVRDTGREGRLSDEAMISDGDLVKLKTDEQLKARLGYPRVFSESPFSPVGVELMDLINATEKYFGIQNSAPFAWNSLLTRAQGKVVTLATPVLRDWLVRSGNKTLFSPNTNGMFHTLKVIQAGVRILQNDERKNKKLRDELENHVRLTTEGLAYLAPYITKQIVTLNRETFEALLRLDGDASLPFISIDSDVLSHLNECAIGPTAVVVRAHPSSSTGSVLDFARYGSPLTFPAWRGATSLRLNVSKTYLKSLRNLFLSDDYAYDLSA